MNVINSAWTFQWLLLLPLGFSSYRRTQWVTLSHIKRHSLPLPGIPSIASWRALESGSQIFLTFISNFKNQPSGNSEHSLKSVWSPVHGCRDFLPALPFWRFFSQQIKLPGQSKYIRLWGLSWLFQMERLDDLWRVFWWKSWNGGSQTSAKKM